MNYTCERRYQVGNESFIEFSNPYEGIPENLIINACTFLVLVLLFAILRRKAWNYGRIALLDRNEERQALRSEGSSYNIWTSLFYGQDSESVSRQQRASNLSLDTHIKETDKGCCSWLLTIFKISDEEYLRKCGSDAVQYLLFQRYLLIYMVTITAISIAVVLPINFQGNLEPGKQSFGHTTISNLDADSPLLWVPAVLGVTYLGLAVLLMAHFSRNLRFDLDDQVTRTLMIARIAKAKCYKNLLVQHFTEAYSEIEVEDVQFAHDITELVSLDRKRQLAAEARLVSEAEWNKTGVRPRIVARTCGRTCGWCGPCCNCHEEDGIEFYGREEAELGEKCEEEKVTAYQQALGIAFVTFRTDLMAAKVAADFRVGCKGAGHTGNPSSVSRDLRVDRWMVRFSPSPENILWENLPTTPVRWWLRAIVINLVLLLLLFFFSTPTVIMNTLDEIFYNKTKEGSHNAVVVHFLPTVLLWTFSALLPNIVYYTDQWIGHWTRTTEHHAVMRKCFVFLLLMVVILPSLGLTSVMALLSYSSSGMDQQRVRWKCIFLPDNGAFFVNYVITSAFIGCALDLCRLPELLSYAARVVLSRSRAEEPNIRKGIVWEFQFGIQYAWMLCMFAVIVTYSICVPLITPFGLLYFGLKHLADRYNIYFAYRPSRISAGIHSSAATFTVWGAIMLQFNILFFSVLRGSEFQAITVFMSVVLFISLICFFGWVFLGWFHNMPCFASPYRYVEEPGMDSDRSASRLPFVAEVLRREEVPSDRPPSGGTREHQRSAGDYGSVGAPQPDI